MLYIYQNKILVNAAGLIGDATCCCGACCYDDPATGKTCAIKTQGECEYLAGEFHPGKKCDEIECSSSSSSSSSSSDSSSSSSDSSSSSSDSSSSSSDSSSSESSASECSGESECAPAEYGPCNEVYPGTCEQYVVRYYCQAGQCLPMPGTEPCACSSSSSYSSEESSSSYSSEESSSSSSSQTTGWACILGWICDDCKQCFCYSNLDNCAGAPVGTKKFKTTITVPQRFSLPVKVVASGGVDDVFMLDGDGSVFGQNPAPYGTPAHGFTYEWVQQNRTFTIEALDTYSGCMGISYTVCIMPIDTDPAAECEPMQELEGSNPCVMNLMMAPSLESQWPTGPGTLLVRQLRRMAPDLDVSNCERRLKKMNEMGPNWCDKNTARILTWIQIEAEKRGHKFNENAARLILKRAIKLARAATK